MAVARGIPIFHANAITIQELQRGFYGGPWFQALRFEVNGQDWELERLLGVGAEGQTFAMNNLTSGCRFAAKFCARANSTEENIVRQMPHRLIEHPSIVRYEMILAGVANLLWPAQHVIFMEEVVNGELFNLLSSKTLKDVPVSKGTSRRFLHDIILGMAECYSCGVTHRDLKPENLMISSEGRIKIIDMGHAKHVEPPAQDEDPVSLVTANVYGTEAFNAPEARCGMEYDCQQSDVWSIGVIAFMLHAKLPAFKHGANGIGNWLDIKGADNARFWSRIQGCGYYRSFPEELKVFINTFWRQIPSERPTFDQLKRAISGDPVVLAEFNGLRWLEGPVNDDSAFAEELLRACPDMRLVINGYTFNAAKHQANTPE